MKKKQLIRLTESGLHRIIKESVKRILNEANKSGKLKKSFKSKEDMTKYRDMYSPRTDVSIYDTDNTLYDTESNEDGLWGLGPYMPYRETRFGDGYDYCGDDDYNDYAYEYNDALHHKLATKGGQMSDDWEKFGPAEYPQKKKEAEIDAAFRKHHFEDWPERSLKRGERHMRQWLKYGNDDLVDGRGEGALDRMETSRY